MKALSLKTQGANRPLVSGKTEVIYWTYGTLVCQPGSDCCRLLAAGVPPSPSPPLGSPASLPVGSLETMGRWVSKSCGLGANFRLSLTRFPHWLYSLLLESNTTCVKQRCLSVWGSVIWPLATCEFCTGRPIFLGLLFPVKEVSRHCGV